MSPRLRIVDLFAGCGGLTSGFQATGSFAAVAAVERDVFAAATYAANFGQQHTHLSDIVDWLQGDIPQSDVVVGGPPCQGFSNLGARRAGDPRNGLWSSYAAAVVKIEPRAFVLENVPDFLRSAQFRALLHETSVGGRLRDYEFRWGTLNAAEFGAAQTRRRGIVIGTHRDLPAIALPTPTHPRERWVTVGEALEGVPFHVTKVPLPASRASLLGHDVPGIFKASDLHVTRIPTARSRERYRHIPPGGNRNDLPHHLQAPCWRKHRSGSGDVMGRLHWDRPSVTVRTEFYKPEKGRYLHPVEDRPLTHLEAARLQGFPDDFQWCGTKTAIAAQIGNAVPVPLANALAVHLAARLSGRPEP